MSGKSPAKIVFVVSNSFMMVCNDSIVSDAGRRSMHKNSLLLYSKELNEILIVTEFQKLGAVSHVGRHRTAILD